MALSAAGPGETGQIVAVLGPTNTGKTRYAIERMLARADGIIGLPLRLLAREVYDTVVALRGPGAAALITGEERIEPRHAKYYICTVEAMPLDRMVDFVAVDEIQMCADPERGHIFTHRLLHARGRYETLFLGSDAARARIASLVPQARYMGRERFSTLGYAGAKKISRLKPRSAVVAFSIDQVYAIAELIRRQRGGAAVVMGALSPRTRNAQVELYQQGDVDYLVATDAIGMGLNLDIDHVAFAGLAKFDGHRHRRLEPNELGQIAGRAGRYTRDGTFGITGEAPEPDPEVVEAIEAHRFKPIARLMWRNAALNFVSVPALLDSLERLPESPDLARAREAEDQASLRAVWEEAEIRARATRPDRIRLLWDVCQIPDFRKVAGQDHAALISRIYRFLLTDSGVIPSDWIAEQVRRIDRVEGDIDTLSKRLAFIRTWTYVANRAAWVEDAAAWQGETRAVEDRLSDALHARLTQRFVDRRTSVLMRRLKQKERLVAEVKDDGTVHVEGEFLGRLDGFRFTLDETASAEEIRTLRSASMGALQAELARRADRLYLTPDTELEITEQGGLLWGTEAIGTLEKGESLMAPRVRAFVDDTAEPAVGEKVTRRLTHFVRRRIDAQFEPLIAMTADEAVTGLARGVAFRLSEALGVIPRRQIAEDVKALGQEERAVLRKHGVRFGQHTVFMPALLKPAPARMRLLLWGLWQGFDEVPAPPPPGAVTIPASEGAPEGFYEMAGYRLCGPRAVRIDMLERLADMIRPLDARAGFEATPDMLSITGCTLEQFAGLMEGLGFEATRGERARAARAGGAPKPANADAAPPPETGTAPAPEMGAAPAPAPEIEAADGAGASVSTTPEAAPPAARQAAPDASAGAVQHDAAPDGTASPAAPVPEGGDAPAQAAAAPERADPAAAANDAGSAAPVPGPGPDPSPPRAPAETEVFYTFTQRPRRPGPRRRPQQADRPGQSEQQARPPRRRRGPPRGDAPPGDTPPPPGASPEQDRPAGSPADARADADTARRPPRGAKGKPGPRGPKPGQKGQKPQAPKDAPRPRREERPPDPDSPFAILAQLKNR